MGTNTAIGLSRVHSSQCSQGIKKKEKSGLMSAVYGAKSERKLMPICCLLL